MNFVTLQDRLSFVLNNNDGQTNQDFSTTRLKQALNWAYEQEVNSAQLEANESWFSAYRDITWESAAVTYALPEDLRGVNIIEILDVTDTTIGSDTVWGDRTTSGALFFVDRNTLQWGVSGPGSDKTLRIVFTPKVSALVNDSDEPELLPAQYHLLIVWSAAILLSEIADEIAPKSWYKNQQELRMGLWKIMSYGRPMGNGPAPKCIDPDVGTGLL